MVDISLIPGTSKSQFCKLYSTKHFQLHRYKSPAALVTMLFVRCAKLTILHTDGMSRSWTRNSVYQLHVERRSSDFNDYVFAVLGQALLLLKFVVGGVILYTFVMWYTYSTYVLEAQPTISRSTKLSCL